MTLRQGYGWGWVLMIELGLLAVLLGGELHPVFFLALPVPILVWPLSPRALTLPGWVGTLVAGVALIAGVIMVAVEGISAILLGGTSALVGILVGRVLSRRTLEHDLQALVLSLLLVFAGTVLHTQITYGLIFVMYAVVSVWALLTRQLVRVARDDAERLGDPARLQAALARRDLITPAFALKTGALSLIVLAATSSVFLLFPRIGFGNLAFLAQSRSQFPSSVSLVGDPRAAGGGTVIARVRGVPYSSYAAGLYLRGPVYERMLASAFVPLEERELMTPSRMRLAPVTHELQYEVFTQPVMGAVLPSLGPVERVEVASGGQANPSLRTRVLGQGPAGEIIAAGVLTGAVRYYVRGGIARPGGHAPDVRLRDNERTQAVVTRFTSLPGDLDPRIAPLAIDVLQQRGLSVDSPIASKVAALRDFLGNGFTYALDHGNGEQPDPLASFLFYDRRGHCEYFATALAALLRAVGVGSRVVGGLQGGTWHGEPDDPEGVVVFTAANAHAWVEWFDPTRGWITEDATPAADVRPTYLTGIGAWLETLSRGWDDYVVDYNAQAQLDLLRSATRAAGSPWQALRVRVPRPVLIAVAAVAVCAMLAFAGWRWLRRRRDARDEHPLAVHLMRAAARMSDEPLAASLTLREVVERVPWPPQALELTRAALALYEGARYGGARVSSDEVRRCCKRLARLKPIPSRG